MSIFHLKIKETDKDVVSKILAGSYEDALTYFSKLKKLSKNKLLSIYVVVEQV